MIRLKENKNVDMLFFSCFDHNRGKDAHGLFQMFKFFREKLKRKSIFVNIDNSLYENKKDVFDISNTGGNMRLSQQISPAFMRLDHPLSWSTYFKNKPELFYTMAANSLIKILPEHKFFIISDINDIDLFILEKVLSHFKSKLLIISAVNNTWTGHCSYPKEFSCVLYKKQSGCDSSCPSIVGKNIKKEKPAERFQKIQKFISRNLNFIYLNVGNSFSLKESEESYLFKNVKKVMIPLKNTKTNDCFDSLWAEKRNNKKYLQNVLNHKTQKIIMWSAFYLDMERKGFKYLLKSLVNLKEQYHFDLKNITLIICARHNNYKFRSDLDLLGIKYWYTGLLNEKEYNKLLSAADLYCSTTISDAGPRTTYESSALATPVISFDNCNASDFVNENNGALIDTYDVEQFTKDLYRILNLDDDEAKKMSMCMYNTYKKVMNPDLLVERWNLFFDECWNDNQ